MTAEHPNEMERNAQIAGFHSLLVAYDSSEPSEAALQYAIEFAVQYKSIITLAYVESSLDYAADLEGGYAQMSYTRDQLLRILQATSDRLTKLEIENKVLHRTGNVSDVLVQLAADLRPDMLFLGGYGFRAAKSGHLGSTAEFMLRSMPCAVVTIGPDAVARYRPLRSSEVFLYASSLPVKTGNATRIAEALARWSHAHIEVLHVIDAKVRPADLRSHAELVKQQGELVQTLREDGFSVSSRLTSGAQGDRILALADELNAGLIIFGVEHHPGLDVTGSISLTIQKAKCPVLTVPGPA
jgi:nucleotide-binding universal stress UspA family protein